MSRRPGIVVDHTVTVDGGVPPNQYHGLVSVQVRCNWPPLATRQEIQDAMTAAFAKAVVEMFNDGRYQQ